MKRTPKIIATALVATVLAGGGVTYAVTQNGNDDTPLTGSDLDKASAAAIAEAGGGTVVDSEQDGDVYEIEVRLDDGTEIDVDLDGSFAVIASETDTPDSADTPDGDGRDADDRAISDAERDSASAAALAETGDGTVIQVEADDGGYDVEVRLADGSEIDVDLDAEFTVIHTESDNDD